MVEMGIERLRHNFLLESRGRTCLLLANNLIRYNLSSSISTSNYFSTVVLRSYLNYSKPLILFSWSGFILYHLTPPITAGILLQPHTLIECLLVIYKHQNKGSSSVDWPVYPIVIPLYKHSLKILHYV